MTVNTSTVPPEILAAHIIRYLETVTQERLIHRTDAKTQRLIKQADIVYLEAFHREKDAASPGSASSGSPEPPADNLIAFPSSKSN